MKHAPLVPKIPHMIHGGDYNPDQWRHIPGTLDEDIRLMKLSGCKLEPTLRDAKPGDRFQFVRIGYFIKDTRYPDTFNRIVGLKDSYPKK